MKPLNVLQRRTTLNFNTIIIGPFEQIITMDLLPTDGPIADTDVKIHKKAYVRVVDGLVDGVGSFDELRMPDSRHIPIETPQVLVPGFIDAHTHICFAGSRADDHAQRMSGKTYHEIAGSGGGILSTVQETRITSKQELVNLLQSKVEKIYTLGTTTAEVKSGYGLNVDDEIKQLDAIAEVNKIGPIDLVSTCLAAHTVPKEFKSAKDYLNYLIKELLPVVRKRNLSNRIDIFVDDGAFTADEAESYLKQAHAMGFSIVIHADQFKRGGAQLAARVKAVSADHLEASNESDFTALKDAEVIPIVLPGSCLGLGRPFPDARKMLDAGLPLVIASDCNPGTSPMDNLVALASMLGAAQKLTMAELLTAITVRAGRALQIVDRGRIAPGYKSDMVAFPCKDWREIFAQQGSLTPITVYTERKLKNGVV